MKRQESTLDNTHTLNLNPQKIKKPNPSDFGENPNGGELFNFTCPGPGEKVMSIYLIRRKIFGQFSSAKQLLICRQVCKTWEREATSALVQPKFERALQISFRYSEPSSAFISDNRENSGQQRTLGDFMQDRMLARKRKGLVENPDFDQDDYQNERELKSHQRPLNFLEDFCTFLKFQGGNIGTDPDAIAFFMDPASRIKSLSVDLYTGSLRSGDRGVTIESFRNMLLRWGNFIKYLDLVSVNWRWFDSLFSGPNDPANVDPAPGILLPQNLQDSEFLAQFDLGLWACARTRTPEADVHLQSAFPALEILRLSHSPFETCPFVVNDILRGAPNLKETFYHNEGDFVDVLETEKKLHTLKSWCFGPRRYEKHVRTIVDRKIPNPIQLYKFGIMKHAVEKHPHAIPMLSQVLKASQASLQTVYDPLVLFDLECSGLIIPPGPFDRVKKVKQGTTLSSLVKVDLTRIFPNVKHFKIRLSNFVPDKKLEMGEINKLALCLTSPLTSVTRFGVYLYHADVSSLNEQSLFQIRRLFPNAVNIQVSTSRIPEQLPQLLYSVFKCFPHAHAISFQFRYQKKQDYCPWEEKRNEDFFLQDSWIQQMDRIITGIDIDIAGQQIPAPAPAPVDQKKLETVFDDREREKQVQSVSIFHMKDLQYFGMDFGCLFPAPRLFSQVAFDYGFDMFKQRKLKKDFQLEFQPKFSPSQV